MLTLEKELEQSTNVFNKDTIVCLVGASGTGKTTIAKELEKQGYNVIQSYTTRLPRYENEWGHTFADTSLFWQHRKQGVVVAETFYDGHSYWITRDQYQNKGTSIFVVDPAGVNQLKLYVHDADIVVIYLYASFDVRLNRLMQRSPIVTEEDLTAVYRRIAYDSDVFSVVVCDYAIDANQSLAQVMKCIHNIIDF